ncbi:hypothetical protein ACYFX5_05175 [Bremerella sp. T1]|uniref:hypothetical protein n=1 Tax=Bremerella sp. TYQ1 TaxID=3119568 RepID=UPI001CCA218C|nr:hypothetical protein [Bremerella volcania]UBM37655.1 hypothetical protein LA756_07130 [Bremerella volcania]
MDFWSDHGLQSVFQDIPIALVVAIPMLALPSLFFGIGLTAADYYKPDFRWLWTSFLITLAAINVFLGLWLGAQMDF